MSLLWMPERETERYEAGGHSRVRVIDDLNLDGRSGTVRSDLFIPKLSRAMIIVGDQPGVDQGVSQRLKSSDEVVIIVGSLPVDHQTGERHELPLPVVPPVRRFVDLLKP